MAWYDKKVDAAPPTRRTGLQPPPNDVGIGIIRRALPFIRMDIGAIKLIHPTPVLRAFGTLGNNPPALGLHPTDHTLTTCTIT